MHRIFLAEFVGLCGAVGTFLAARWLLDISTPARDILGLRSMLSAMPTQPHDQTTSRLSWLKNRQWLDISPILVQRRLVALKERVQRERSNGTVATDERND